MSIETILTLMVAAALLVTAAVLRVLFVGIVRLTRKALGADGTPARLDDALPATPLRERMGAALEGAGALLIYAVALIANIVRKISEGIRIAARVTWYAAVAAYSWVAPRTQRAGRRIAHEARVLGDWLAPRADVASRNLLVAREAPVPAMTQRTTGAPRSRRPARVA